MLKNLFSADRYWKKIHQTDIIHVINSNQYLTRYVFQVEDWPFRKKKVKNTTFNKIDFSKIRFIETTFTGCEFVDCLFVGSIISESEFHDCKFINCSMYKVKIENTYIDPLSFCFERDFFSSYANLQVGLFQQLFENSSKEHQRAFKEAADIGYRVWLRYQRKHDMERKKIGITRYITEMIVDLLYRKLMNYGYGLFRYIIIIFSVIISVSFFNMYTILNGGVSVGSDCISSVDFSSSIFYTFSIMSALGFSYIAPITVAAKAVTIIEVVLGMALFSILFAMIVKRVVR